MHSPGKGRKATQQVQQVQQALPTSDKQGVQGDQQVNKQDQQALATSSKPDLQGEQQVDKQVLTDEALLAYWQANPQASDGQVAKYFGRSAQAIQQRRVKLTARGAFYLPANEPSDKVQS